MPFKHVSRNGRKQRKSLFRIILEMTSLLRLEGTTISPGF